VTEEFPLGVEVTVALEAVEVNRVVETSVVVGTTETEVTVETAVELTVETTELVEDGAELAVGMVKVTPAAWQRAPAAWTVASNCSAEQAPWTQGTREVTKAVAWQIQAMSVVAQPVLPNEEIAQERAHGGMLSSPWAETKVAAAKAMTVEAFILKY